MTPFFLSIVLFSLLVIGLTIIFILLKSIKLKNVFIFLTLFSLWFTMFIYRQNHLTQEVVTKTQSWIWPIIASLYQFTQMIVRIPLAKLSQKLHSRKIIIQLTGIIMILGIVILIITKMSIAGIVIASITSGIFGSTFILGAHSWSENWNLKKVFISSAIIFTIPVAAKLLATSLNNVIKITPSNTNWLLIIGVILASITLVLYTFIKEDRSKIHRGNVTDQKIIVKDRGMKDVIALSFTSAFLTFGYTFVTAFGVSSMKVVSDWMSLVEFISLLGSLIMAYIFSKMMIATIVRRVSIGMMAIAFICLGLLNIFQEMNPTLWIVIILFASFGFGSYIMALFGTALHFDHKYPVLVLGIFLSIKSGAISLATLSSNFIIEAINKNHHSQRMQGWLIIGVGLFSLLLAEFSTYYFTLKIKSDHNKKIDDMINQFVGYEINEIPR